MKLTRRGLAVAAACTCGLAACSSQPKGSPGSAQPPTSGSSSTESSSGSSTQPSQATSSGGASGESSASGSNLGQGKFVPKSQVPVGGGIIVTEGEVVITQPEAGQFKAFTSLCTHKQCPVSEVADSVISCNCHGSQFSIVDGSVKRGPASEPLAPKQIEVKGDQISVL